MSLINREALLAEYDRVHVGEPGKARELIEDAPTVESERKPCKGCMHLPQMYKFPCTSCARNTMLLDRWEEGEK